MNNSKQSIWQNLAYFGKTILAHVKINYDGSTGALHIDIIPTEYQEVGFSEQKLSISHQTKSAALIDQ